MNLKVPINANFFWATFFILYDPLEFSTGACPTPSGIEMVKTHHCALCVQMEFTRTFDANTICNNIDHV